MEKFQFDVKGMTCSACQANIERRLAKNQGLKSYQVNLLTNTLSIEAEAGEIAQVKKDLAQLGYQIEAKSEQTNYFEASAKKLSAIYQRLVQSIGLLLLLMLLAMGPMFGLKLPLSPALNAALQFILTTIIIYFNRSFFQQGFPALIARSPNMDSLIALGSTAAYLYSFYLSLLLWFGQIQDLPHLYFEAAAMIPVLISLGKYLELRASLQTSQTIRQMMDLAPKMARLAETNEEIPLEEVKLGDLILVLPGEKMPVDGEVIEGESSADEAFLTGESLPVAKAKGSLVYAASLNQTGRLLVRTTKLAKDSSLAQIIALVQEASSSKAPIARLADKISRFFVPIVILIATLTFATWLFLGQTFDLALSMAISVLVISCPCALGLATPVSIMVATGQAAKAHILIKSGESLESLASIDAVVLDKTGTITKGQAQVCDIYEIEGVDLLDIAARIEAGSEHPLAAAVLRAASLENREFEAVAKTEIISGMGIKAKLDGKYHFIGSLAFLTKQGLASPKIKELSLKLALDAKSLLHVFTENKWLGLISVHDQVKQSSKEALKLIRREKIKTYMLTGDNQATAEAVAKDLALDQVVAEVLPSAKAEFIQKLQSQGKKVAMCGDGINDAPSLIQADVGLAIAAGTDIAIDAADLVLVKSDLMDLVAAIKLSRATVTNIKQNLFWAFFYNVLCIPLAAGVFYLPYGLSLNPMIAALAMSFSSIFVVLNSLRLRKFNFVSGQKEQDLDLTFNLNRQKIKAEKEGERKVMNSLDLKVKGMMCQHCVNRVKEVLTKANLVNIEIDLETARVKAQSKEQIRLDEIKKSILDAGYQVLD